ncbi:MAG: hypothetical protein M0Z67_08800 [Nitrospiraceae bacterium]|nr:hypothetical protein [Nitrospiraceae bacterium]
MNRIFISFCLLFCLLCSSSFALEKLTHERLNEVIAPQINQSLVALGFPQGVEAFVNGEKIIRWIKDGGIKEDEPVYSRSLNHFHNPLKTWDIAGFKGTFQLSVIWAQDQGAFGSLWGGDFSWKKDREYFYTALTGKDFSGNMIAPTQSEKGKYFANTFRGIGQVMHLVEDASVPAHTRDDSNKGASHV